MDRRDNMILKEAARELRNHQTPEEKRLWYDFLRNYPEKILRQKIIDNYIVDFYCSKAKLAIELDGIQHFTKNGKAQDKARTEILEAHGVAVIRFKNEEVWQNFENICNEIDHAVKSRIENQHK